MKNITLTIDGKEISVQISQEEAEKLTQKPVRTGYERVEAGERYYCTSEVGDCETGRDSRYNCDDGRYEAANYTNDEVLGENKARAEKLMRQLERFAVIENAKAGIVLNWGDNTRTKWFIRFNHLDYEIDIIHCWNISITGATYFATKQIAEKAIKEFNEELLWYFTEYKNYYVEE